MYIACSQLVKDPLPITFMALPLLGIWSTLHSDNGHINLLLTVITTLVTYISTFLTESLYISSHLGY